MIGEYGIRKLGLNMIVMRILKTIWDALKIKPKHNQTLTYEIFYFSREL